MTIELNEVSGKSLMEQALWEIRKQVPTMKNAKIQTHKDKKGEFITKVEVFVKKRRAVAAEKIGSTAKQSITGAIDAVLKQLAKIKSKDSKTVRVSLRDLELRQSPI